MLRQSSMAGVCVMIYKHDGVRTIGDRVKRCEGHQATLVLLSLPILLALYIHKIIFMGLFSSMMWCSRLTVYRLLFDFEAWPADIGTIIIAVLYVLNVENALLFE